LMTWTFGGNEQRARTETLIVREIFGGCQEEEGNLLVRGQFTSHATGGRIAVLDRFRKRGASCLGPGDCVARSVVWMVSVVPKPSSHQSFPR